MNVNPILSIAAMQKENRAVKSRYNRWLFAATASFLILSGCVSALEGPVGKKHQPVIQAVAAQNEIGTDYPWKIYIHATDPNGDMDKIYVTFEQTSGMYSGYPLVLSQPVLEINGAVMTMTQLDGTGFHSGELSASVEIRVEDRAGNMSEPKSISFRVGPYGPEDKFTPPPPMNKDIVYGQVHFPIRGENATLK